MRGARAEGLMWARQMLAVMGGVLIALLAVMDWGRFEAPRRHDLSAAEATVPANDSASQSVQLPKPEPKSAKPPTHRRWMVGDGFVLAVSPEKERDLNVRRKRRAFLGAPPTIPHKLETLDLCGNCHDVGASLREGIAPMRPHFNLANCTQCHVEAVNQRFGKVVDSPNTFRGQPEPLGGPRAFIGAPPAVPHPIALRTKCLACHGQFGLPAIRTPHPERADCRQCHVSFATSDRQP